VFPLENNGESYLYDGIKEEESDLIYKKDGIEIYKGDEEYKCIKYSKGFSWCIDF